MRRCLKKFKRCLNSNVKFRVLYDTKKISFYCNIKDKVPHDQRNHVTYKIKCPFCNGCYIGKTKRCLITTKNINKLKKISVEKNDKNAIILYS